MYIITEEDECDKNMEWWEHMREQQQAPLRPTLCHALLLPLVSCSLPVGTETYWAQFCAIQPIVVATIPDFSGAALTHSGADFDSYRFHILVLIINSIFFKFVKKKFRLLIGFVKLYQLEKFGFYLHCICRTF